VFLRVDFQFRLIKWVLGTELLAKGSQRGTPTIPKVSLWSVERIGRSITWRFEFFPRVDVTEPPKIISYYCLSRSTWSLSNNKELFCHFHRVKPGESLTTGSRYALSPHEGGTRVQHYIR
jgi:hypothetical protein